MLLRTIFHTLRARRRSPLGITDVGHLPLRVWPGDLDILRHVNNGVYFSLMDLGRFDLIQRTGMGAALTKNGFYPVVANETMTFRKSLQPWQKYVLESRLDSVDEKSVYMRQRFVVDGEIYAEGFIRARFLKRKGGTVSLAELSEALGVDVSHMPPPEWVKDWVDSVTLPPTRGEAPSVWN